MIGPIIAATIMAVYLGWYCIRYGVPGSISQTVYKLPHESLFTILMYSVACLTIMPMMDACSENTAILAFLTIGSIGFVGAAPLGKNCSEGVHMAAAMIFGLCSQLMIAFNSPIMLLTWVPAAIIIYVTKGRNWLFWAELACVSNLLWFCINAH